MDESVLGDIRFQVKSCMELVVWALGWQYWMKHIGLENPEVVFGTCADREAQITFVVDSLPISRV